MTDRPLILLDVDGVINDLHRLYGGSRPWRTDVVRSHGYDICIPDYMPGLIQHLMSLGEVRWCTTWRHRANDEIAAHLGIGRLEVVDDGSGARSVDWKAEAAYELAADALRAGRRVYWIEDFYGRPPVDEMPDGVVFVDTTARDDRVLLPDHLPAGLSCPDIGAVGGQAA